MQNANLNMVIAQVRQRAPHQPRLQCHFRAPRGDAPRQRCVQQRMCGRREPETLLAPGGFGRVWRLRLGGVCRPQQHSMCICALSQTSATQSAFKRGLKLVVVDPAKFVVG